MYIKAWKKSDFPELCNCGLTLLLISWSERDRVRWLRNLAGSVYKCYTDRHAVAYVVFEQQYCTHYIWRTLDVTLHLDMNYTLKIVIHYLSFFYPYSCKVYIFLEYYCIYCIYFISFFLNTSDIAAFKQLTNMNDIPLDICSLMTHAHSRSVYSGQGSAGSKAYPRNILDATSLH